MEQQVWFVEKVSMALTIGSFSAWSLLKEHIVFKFDRIIDVWLEMNYPLFSLLLCYPDQE